MHITIKNWNPDHEKEIVNSIKGFAKSLAKRFGFEMEFSTEG